MEHLTQRGPTPLPELLRAVQFDLTATLRALHDLREFRLIEMTDDELIVRLTDRGRTLAISVAKDSMRADATRLLEVT